MSLEGSLVVNGVVFVVGKGKGKRKRMLCLALALGLLQLFESFCGEWARLLLCLIVAVGEMNRQKMMTIVEAYMFCVCVLKN